MAPHTGSDADYFKDKARRDLLALLEGVSKAPNFPQTLVPLRLKHPQVRGKKNLVISQDLAGPVGLFVRFSVLQEYGVDRVFLLENANVDSSQRNVVFLVHAEKIRHVRTVAGMHFIIFLASGYVNIPLQLLRAPHSYDGTTVDYADSSPLYVISQSSLDQLCIRYIRSSSLRLSFSTSPNECHQNELTFHRSDPALAAEWQC